MAKTTTPRKLTWRDRSDANHRSFPAPPNPESLHPGPSTVERAVNGNDEAREILNAYAFRFPVSVVEVIP